MWNYTYKSWYFDWERPHAFDQGYWYPGTGVSFNIYCGLQGKKKKKKKTYGRWRYKSSFQSPRWNLYFRLDIILVKGVSKHTLNTYFSGKKIDPKYAFFACVFLNFPYVLSKMCQYDQKHTPFSIFARFCTPKRCKRVHCLVLKNNPNYVNFFTRMIPNFKYKCPPPGISIQLAYVELSNSRVVIPVELRDGFMACSCFPLF